MIHAFLHRVCESLYYRLSLGSYYLLFDLAILSTLALAAILVYCLRRRLHPSMRRLFLGVLTILALRILVFGNPLLWKAFSRELTAEDVGWRQRDVLRIEADKYRLRLEQEPVAVLAVGSSQTQALYGGETARRLGISLFSAAGLAPLDFWLYRDQIAALRPRIILLYLSEFDLARKPSLDTLVLGPPQGASWMTLLGWLRPQLSDGDSWAVVATSAAAEGVPEYRCSFAFKGLLDKWTGYRAATVGANPSLQRTRNEQLTSLERNLGPQGMDEQCAILRGFLEYMENKTNAHVVIVQGQFRPDAYNETRWSLRREADCRLQQLAASFPHVDYWRNVPALTFRDSEFLDVYHVRPEAGARFTREVAARLQPIVIRTGEGSESRSGDLLPPPLASKAWPSALRRRRRCSRILQGEQSLPAPAPGCLALPLLLGAAPPPGTEVPDSRYLPRLDAHAPGSAPAGFEPVRIRWDFRKPGSVVCVSFRRVCLTPPTSCQAPGHGDASLWWRSPGQAVAKGELAALGVRGRLSRNAHDLSRKVLKDRDKLGLSGEVHT